jgi:hypothetical protein
MAKIVKDDSDWSGDAALFQQAAKEGGTYVLTVIAPTAPFLAPSLIRLVSLDGHIMELREGAEKWMIVVQSRETRLGFTCRVQTVEANFRSSRLVIGVPYV